MNSIEYLDFCVVIKKDVNRTNSHLLGVASSANNYDYARACARILVAKLRIMSCLNKPDLKTRLIIQNRRSVPSFLSENPAKSVIKKEMAPQNMPFDFGLGGSRSPRTFGLALEVCMTFAPRWRNACRLWVRASLLPRTASRSIKSLLSKATT